MKRSRTRTVPSTDEGEFDLEQMNDAARTKERNDKTPNASESESDSNNSGSDSDQIASSGEDSADSEGELGSEDELVAISDDDEISMPPAFAQFEQTSSITSTSSSSASSSSADFPESIRHGRGTWHTRGPSSSSSSSSSSSTDNGRVYKGMQKREEELAAAEANGSLEAAKFMHVDDLSSDDEEAGNTIGNVPLHWYDDHDHIGYGLDGKRIAKKVSVRGDGLDRYLASKDDPNFRRTVYDAKNDREVVLSDRQLELIRNVLKGGFAHPEFNDHQEFVPFFSQHVQIHPLTAAPAPKARFLPDKWERQKVLKIAQAIKEGRIIIGEKKEEKQDLYMLWGDDESSGFVKGKKAPPRLAMPKMTLPGHKESYNPPSEYLLDATETAAWEEQDPEERTDDFLPSKFPSLKMVPGYKNFVSERFERCRDLYWASRKRVNRLNIKPESLLPRIPDVEELRPFPTTRAIEYEGHNDHRVRCITVSPSGQWLASGNDNGEVLLHEIETGRLLCRRTVALEENTSLKKKREKGKKKNVPESEVDRVVRCIRWNPNPQRSMVAVCVGDVVRLIKIGMSTKKVLDGTNALMVNAMQGGVIADADANAAAAKDDENDDDDGDEDEDEDGEDDEEDATKNKNKEKTTSTTTWTSWKSKTPSLNHVLEEGATLSLKDWVRTKEIVWHAKGDYFATIADAGAKRNVCMVHQLSKCTSAALFRKVDKIQSVEFHPSKPFIFLATQTHVRVYSLSKPVKLKKKLLSSAKWMSSLVVHPSGDHLLTGTYDKRVCWFDLDGPNRPYKTYQYHDKAVRQVRFHAKYNLMASCSDDGSVRVLHARVYDDLVRQPLIVPVRTLRGHTITADKLSVLDICFHPTQPWIFSSGADGKIFMYQNLH
jgi:ribosome biogenesis protein ERB1